MRVLVVILAVADGVLVVTGAVISPFNWFAIIFLAGFLSLWVLPLYLEFFHVRIVATDEGLLCHSPWRASRNVRWEEIKSVDFSPELQWYRIHTAGKRIVRLYVLLSGLQTLFDLLEQKTGIKVERRNPLQ